jgi:hypothetical protein
MSIAMFLLPLWGRLGRGPTAEDPHPASESLA